MKLYTEIYLILVIGAFFIDFLLYKQSKKRIFITKVFTFGSSILFITGFTWVKLFYKFYADPHLPFYIMWFDFCFLIIYSSKLLLIISNFIKAKSTFTPKTINIFTTLILSVSVFVLFAGAFFYPKKTNTTTVEISFKNLPEQFTDYCIVQFSDVHLGSRPSEFEFYKQIVSEINRQNPDLVVFTGDMVNNFESEMDGFDSIFLEIKSKDGTFAVLGNHDYGDYTVWDSPQKKAKNLQKLKNHFSKFGFRLLNNESVFIRKQNDSIELIGVENFSKKGQKNYSNLTKAMINNQIASFKILLSHNPEHWDCEIVPKTDIDLTLSGHTHAAQMGWKLFGKVYSPAVLKYPQYNGLYEKDNQKIYVSRGVGYIGLPMIMGLHPEITVIKLKKLQL